MKKVFLLAIATFAMALSTKSQVMYTDLESNPIVIDANNMEYELNLAGGETEFMIQNYYAMSTDEYAYFASFSSGSAVVSSSADYNANVNLLSEGTTIGSSSTFFGSEDGTPYFNVLLGYDYQSWLNQTGYVGFKFLLNGATHYGWAKISVTASAITLYGYAYQSTANTSIAAGNKGTSSLDDAIQETNNINLISIYPNPTSDLLMIDNTENVQNIEIMNLCGQVVLTNNALNTQSVDVSNLQRGIYYISLLTNNEKIVKKFIKK